MHCTAVQCRKGRHGTRENDIVLRVRRVEGRGGNNIAFSCKRILLFGNFWFSDKLIKIRIVRSHIIWQIIIICTIWLFCMWCVRRVCLPCCVGEVQFLADNKLIRWRMGSGMVAVMLAADCVAVDMKSHFRHFGKSCWEARGHLTDYQTLFSIYIHI